MDFLSSPLPRFGQPGEALLSRGEDELPAAGLLPQLEACPTLRMTPLQQTASDLLFLDSVTVVNSTCTLLTFAAGCQYGLLLLMCHRAP